MLMNRLLQLQYTVNIYSNIEKEQAPNVNIRTTSICILRIFSRKEHILEDMITYQINKCDSQEYIFLVDASLKKGRYKNKKLWYIELKGAKK